MENIWHILATVGIGLLGIVFYTLFRSKKYFIQWKPFKEVRPKHVGKWSAKTLVNENAGNWMWSLIIIVVISLLYEYVPEAIEPLADWAALDITDKASFFLMGLTLCAMTKSGSINE